MTTLRSRIIAWAGRLYMARTRKKGFDLSRMSFLPDSVLMPLRRQGLDPVGELATVREQEPIAKLPVPIAANVWLVTGYDEVKAVLGKANAFSSDFTNLIGQAGASTDQNPGGLGFADPPVHTRLRRLLTPEFTMRRLGRLTPASTRSWRSGWTPWRRPAAPVSRSTSWKPLRCRFRRWSFVNCSVCRTRTARTSSG